MLSGRLLVGTFLALLMAGLTWRIGWPFLQHKEPGGVGRALRRFGVWWLVLGADALVNAATWLLGGLGLATPPVVAALTFLALACVAAMLWGLMSHLAFLMSGRDGIFRLVTAFYVLEALAAGALILWLQPVGVTLGGLGGEIAYARPVPPWAALGVALFFLVPPLVAAVCYGILSRRAKDRVARRRIRTVAAGIATWLLASLVVTATGVSGDVVAAAGSVIALSCMALIARAYRGPHHALAVHEAPSAVARMQFDDRLRQLL